MNAYAVFVVMVAALLSCSGIAVAGTLVLQDADTENLDDAQLWARYPDANYGHETFVHFCSAFYSQRQALFKFDLSQLYTAIGNADDIISAELNLYAYYETLDRDDECVTMSSHHIYSYPAYQIGGLEWDEYSVTWGNRPASSSEYDTAPSDSTVFCGNNSPDVWLPFDVTDMVKTEFMEGDHNLSVFIVTDQISGHSSGDYLKTRSKESIHDDQRPLLRIHYQGSGSDVAVTDFSAVYPQNPVAGDDILFQFRLSNLGDEDLEDIYYKVATQGEPAYLYNNQPISLAAGDFMTVYELWSYPASGDYFPEVFVDYEDLIDEYDESNNIRDLHVHVGGLVIPPSGGGGKILTSMVEGGWSE
ncbi:MAG: DNRLRE domain-containing protein [Nanoarchaeota archaeon]